MNNTGKSLLYAAVRRLVHTLVFDVWLEFYWSDSFAYIPSRRPSACYTLSMTAGCISFMLLGGTDKCFHRVVCLSVCLSVWHTRCAIANGQG